MTIFSIHSKFIVSILIYRANDIKIEPPYVNSLLVDYNYLGYCASISFESLKSYLKNTGELNQNTIDAGFVAIIFLKVAWKIAKIRNCT